MRTPLQILFLILVTDLPPAIALGMEPGDRDIMRDRPRPKKQPIMLRWMAKFCWAKGFACTIPNVIAYLLALNHYIGELDYDNISKDVQKELGDFKICEAKEQEAHPDWNTDQLFEACYNVSGREAAVYKAQTACFIGMVWSENVMGYVARSFDRPMWHNFLGNVHMQWATAIAETGLMIAIFLLPLLWFPAKKYFLSLDATLIGWEGWIFAMIGAGGTIFFCELYKLYARKDIKRFLAQQKADSERTKEVVDIKEVEMAV